MTKAEFVGFDYARAAIAICTAVDTGDMASFLALVDDYDQGDWVSLAEQTLALLRESLHEIGCLTERPVRAVYEDRLEHLVNEERQGVSPRNLVMACLSRRFGYQRGTEMPP